MIQDKASSTIQSRVAFSWPRLLTIGLLSIGTLFFLLQTILSLQWHIAHDTAFLHYIAFLIDSYDYIPYQDIHDTSFPIAFLFHVVIGKAFGYGDLAFRVVDVVYLAALSFVTWRVLRPLGGLVAWAAMLVFGLLYQGAGPMMTLQRDYLALLPLAAAIWVAGGRSGRWHYLAIGGLFGFAVSVKPHFIIGLPPVLLYALASRGDWRGDWKHPDWRGLVQASLLSGLGLALVFSLPFLWLWREGGLPAFWEVMTDYLLPLYNELDGNLSTPPPYERWADAFLSFQSLGGGSALLMTAVLGVYFGLGETRLTASQRRLVALLATMAVLSVVYTMIAGKFWPYHWMPFFYFATCCGALVMLPLQERAGHHHRQLFALAVFTVGLVLTLRPATVVYRQLTGRPPTTEVDDRAAGMTAFLQRELRPGDTVQPLDGITGGSTIALRRVGARLATPYLNDTQFYHHVSDPTIQGMRQDFMTRLEAAPPRFIITVPSASRPRGPGTADFLELERFVAERYHVALDGGDYFIYERKD